MCDVPYEAKRSGGFSAFSCLYFVTRLVYLWSTGIEGRVLGMGDFPHQTTFTPFQITLFMGDSPRQIFNFIIISKFEIINIHIAIEYYSMHTHSFPIDFVTNIARAILKLWCVLSTFTWQKQVSITVDGCKIILSVEPHGFVKRNYASFMLKFDPGIPGVHPTRFGISWFR